MTANKQFFFLGIFIWLITAVFFMYEFLLRTVIGTFQHPIMYDLQLSTFSFAIISSSAYQLTYGIMQLPVGIISDRFGLKKALFLGASICTVSAFAFSFTQGTIDAIGYRALMGLGSSFGFICMLVAVYEWLPRQHIGFFIGLSQFIGTMGPIFAAGPVSSLTGEHNIDWRYFFQLFAGVGIFICALVVLFVKNNRHRQQGPFIVLSLDEPVKNNLRRILIQPQAWLIALYSAFVYFAIEYFSENEGKLFLELKGHSSSFSSYMLTIAWIGYAVGCPLLGLCSDFFKRRKPFLVLAAGSCCVALVGIVYFDPNQTILAFLFFLLGLGAGGQSIGFAIMAEQCQDNYLAVGLGLNNGMIMLVTALNAPFIGWILTLISESAHTVQDYQVAFSVVVVFCAMAFFGALLLIKETFCKSIREPITLSY